MLKLIRISGHASLALGIVGIIIFVGEDFLLTSLWNVMHINPWAVIASIIIIIVTCVDLFVAYKMSLLAVIVSLLIWAWNLRSFGEAIFEKVPYQLYWYDRAIWVFLTVFSVIKLVTSVLVIIERVKQANP